MIRSGVRKRYAAVALAGLCFGMLLPESGQCQTATTGWTSEASTAMQEQGCDPAVVQRISQAQDAQIRAQSEMAHALFDYIKQLKTDAASCLSGLMPHSYLVRGGFGNLWDQNGIPVCNVIEQLADPTSHPCNV